MMNSTIVTEKFFTSDPVNPRNIAAKVAIMAFYNFVWRYNVLVYWSESDILGVSNFIKFYGKSVIAQKGRIHNVPAKAVSQYILFGTSLDVLKGLIKDLEIKKFDNTGKYFIICVRKGNHNCDEGVMMKFLWSFRIVNVVFIQSIGKEGKFNVYTYYPYDGVTCESTKPVQLTINQSITPKKRYLNLFPEKMANLYGCPLIFSTIDQTPYMSFKHLNNKTEIEGIDWELIQILSKTMNFTFTIKVAKIFGNQVGETWTGSFGDIMNETVNFSVIAAAITHERYQIFHLSFTYNVKEISWATGVNRYPNWTKLTNPIRFNIRIVIFTSFFLVAFIGIFVRTKLWRIIEKYLNMNSRGKSLLFESWILFTGQVSNMKLQKPALTVMFVLWILYALVIRAIYQAVLVSSLKRVVYEEEYDSLLDLMNASIPFGGPPSFRSYFEEDELYYDNFVLVKESDSPALLDAIATGEKKFALGISKSLIVNYLRHYNGTRKLQLLKERIAITPLSIFFKKYSPLEQPISDSLSKILEGGFIEKTARQYFTKVKVSDDEAAPVPLDLSQLDGCWFIVLIMWTLCILVFIWEVIYGRYYRKKRVIAGYRFRAIF